MGAFPCEMERKSAHPSPRVPPWHAFVPELSHAGAHGCAGAGHALAMTTLHAVAGDSDRTLRQHLHDNQLREPDELRPHEDGSVVCVWHERSVALIVDLEDP